jgi:AcrR family transcriptional regulator
MTIKQRRKKAADHANEGKLAPTRRRYGKVSSATRAILLDATEHLMMNDGYAAVTTRRVAAQAGLKAPIVHYYFPTMEDLLLAVYRRMAEQNLERLVSALTSAQPLRALWNLSCNQEHTGLALEFLALANHRKIIRAEIARRAEGFRRMQAEALTGLLKNRLPEWKLCPPIGVTVLVAGLARILVMENTLGISSGHAEARAYVESILRHFDAAPTQGNGRRTPGRLVKRASKGRVRSE